MALDFLDMGLCPMPPKQDGSKAPYASTWKQFEKRPPTTREVMGWYRAPLTGIGTITGAVAGNLELFEFDDLDTYLAFCEVAVEAGLVDLVERVKGGYSERTPGLGVHWFYRCEEIAGNTKLASVPRPTPDNPKGVKVLIETRGQGGYAVMAPSFGTVHPSGKPYEVMEGRPEDIVTVTPEERAALWALARTFDLMPVREVTPAAVRTEATGDRPGDIFNRDARWADVLGPAGWKAVYSRGGTTYWRRPGKSHGVSATTNHTGADTLIVFSTSTPFDPSPSSYSKFAAYTVINHDGDYQAAGKELLAQGYGEAPQGAYVSLTWGQGNKGAPSSIEQEWPAPCDEDAFYGLAGDIVRTVDGYTEGDPVAVLANFLAAFGAEVGGGPHFMVGATRQPARTYFALVGKSGKARKGDSQAPVTSIFKYADETFATRLLSGLSTGEGLISAVRDRVEHLEMNKKTGEYETVVLDDGVLDKRLLVVEPELGRVLSVMGRQGNTLSAVARDAWDQRPLETMTKTKMRATDPHITLVGHITLDELRTLLDANAAANGFGNRFCWLAVKRSKELPRPPAFTGDVVADLGERVWQAMNAAKGIGEMDFDADTGEVWNEAYHELSADRPGLAGSVANRAEAHTLRLAMLYALLDGSSLININHLTAGMAMWDYCERSAQFIFGKASGDPHADTILRALRVAPMSRLDISNLFGRHAEKAVIEAALGGLTDRGQAEMWKESPPSGTGRPVEMWRTRS